MTSTSPLANFAPLVVPSPAENGVFAALETAFGDALWERLRDYLQVGEAACEKLQEATGYAHWQEAVRQAKIIASKAHDLDFRGVNEAIRSFAATAYDSQASAHARRNGAQLVVMEFERSKILIESRYPGLMASDGVSVA